PIRKLSLTLQHDIRAFFGSYKKACSDADDLLFRAGDADAIDQACRESKVGKLLPNALYIHQSALTALDPLLRVFEGCGRAFLGEVDGANVIKLHRFSGKVSYLVYPDFETDPHPVLHRSFKLSLRTLDVDCYDYSQSENPPILHRKETFLEPTHPLYQRFSRLTEQEEGHRLLDDSRTIGTKAGWEQRLRGGGFALRGHRLVRMQSEHE
ncbi:MAG: DNA phosphorothioation-associated putative methyltransferase, partial [Myxococcales bacterium]|nr:DNA phosphorothioation-associated putative methyltransferase [Myxococcales bacterium]